MKNGSLVPFDSLPYIAISTSATIEAALAGSGIANGLILNVCSGFAGSIDKTSISKFLATPINCDMKLPSFSTTVIPKFL